jgi:arabinose-5-phosphate isomerase
MIKLVVFDFDGVFTDGKVFFENNYIKKFYNIKDGKGLALLRQNNIKYCLLSNFSNNKTLKVNDNDISDLLKHLKFNKTFIGSGNKLEILDKWLAELKIKYNEVAYIGDDINDKQVMMKVKLSGCPNDAINEVKNIADYKCKNNGGCCCVREFCEKVIEFNSKDNNGFNIISEIKKDFNYQIDNFEFDKINTLVKLILNTKNNVYFIGIGKSGNIAKHCCDLLKSVSINCHYLDSVNLLHGDIGVINKNILILFSKSGNTKEIVDIIPFFKTKNCYIVGVCCDDNSKFEEYSDLLIKAPFIKEVSGKINKIPTNSYMSHLLFSNILVSKLKNNINLSEYQQNHPAGSIGKNLRIIKDVLIYDYPKIILVDNVNITNILLEMTNYKIGCCFFVNNKNKLIGILTDGDIRRLLLNKISKKFININDINKNYYCESDINKFIFKCKKTKYIPIITDDKFKGIIIN